MSRSCAPDEAIDCFKRTKMDVLAIGPFLVHKPETESVDDSTSEAKKQFV